MAVGPSLQQSDEEINALSDVPLFFARRDVLICGSGKDQFTALSDMER